jgi:hypothetical protein
MKSILFKNRINNEKLICDNIQNIQIIDGVEYYQVRRENQERQFLMRKDVLVKNQKNDNFKSGLK